MFFVANVEGESFLWVYDPDFNSMPCLNFSVDNTVVTNVNGANLGSILIQVSGGAEPYSYQLDGGPSTDNPLFENLSVGNYTILITDDNGCTVEVQAEVDLETSILNPSLINSFQLFPNPVSADHLTLRMFVANEIENINIEIFDVSGKRIFKQKNIDVIGNNLDHKIPVHNFLPGEYLVFIYAENQKLVADKFTVLDSN